MKKKKDVGSLDLLPKLQLINPRVYRIAQEILVRASWGFRLLSWHASQHSYIWKVESRQATVELCFLSDSPATETMGPIEHLHIWHGSQHHQFRQKVGLELSGEDKVQDKRSHTEASSHSPGTVVTPMAGFVVKVLFEDGAKVEAGQPVLVLEAMKMEFDGGLSRTPLKKGTDLNRDGGETKSYLWIHEDAKELFSDAQMGKNHSMN
ncbi:Methylcrotonoyl-CoA carboxylase subunit alpha, mitochondrial-like protein [Drosera capensis]